MEQTTYFDIILRNIFELPIWVKQAIFVELKENLLEQSAFVKIDTTSKHNLLQLYRPVLTQNGLKALKEKNPNLTVDILNFLQYAEKKLRIIDICQQNNWTLAKCCENIADSIDLFFIEPIYSSQLACTMYFLAGKIRIGEFLVRTGKITVEQLDMALYSQKYTEGTLGERIQIGQILVNLRYITPEDYENILFLKHYGEELYTMSFNDSIDDMNEHIKNLGVEINLLKKEKTQLRENLSKCFDDAQVVATLLDKIDKLKKENNELKKFKH